MDDNSVSNILKPIDEEERIQLQNKLNEQRLELEEKKKYLEELKKSNERAKGVSELQYTDDYPDPDKMLENFLESLEKDEKEIGELYEQRKDKDMKYLDNHLISSNISNDKFYNNNNSLEDQMEQSFIFKKKTSIKNFNFKINKLNEARVINVQQKDIKHFDKSIQVNLIDEKNTTTEKKKEKITALSLNKDHSINKIKGDKLNNNIVNDKKSVILKLKKKKKKKSVKKEDQQQKDKKKENEEENEEKMRKEDRKENEYEDEEEDEEEEEEEGEDEDEEEIKKDIEDKTKKVSKLKISKKKSLDEEKKKNILNSNNFIKFIENTSKIVERTLGEQEMFNTIFDFVSKDLSEESESLEKLKLLNTYYCKKYTSGRPITDVKTSHIYSELFLASYGTSETATSTDPDGYVLVWNTSMNNRPEYVFTSQPAVCTALFNKFNPHLIIGGTYTGNILLWDIRAREKPVQKTLLSANGHLHPIYCAEIIGTQNAHNLVTADTDGRLCNWSLNMLTCPSDTVDLKRGNKEVSCCCFSFQEGEINTLYGGAEDGSLFQAQIHGTKVGITESYNIHNGQLTATQFHPLIEGTNDHNDLLLTASVDWTCKLLSVKNATNPLFTFDAFEDYLMDIKWNPVHPGIFATSSSNGQIKVWNISYDIECPYFETSINEKSTNKIAWSCEGKKLIAGNSDGSLTLWNTSSEIYQPRSEDIAKFENKIAKMKTECIATDHTEIEI
ncbi:cytoplasmic dynein intermediate chain, putative [Plasmodium relictum]|uniref:Cytoplasmic dynein intermediate chain, putative n=1 Tax=Plasmodium relictum TaxID=85471 RepID=A0A1J1H3D5_PLARL|nr:cytoplasmic dynein intermediate chain, putative [Plasmodium relictum]CRG99064.1 cytoplasmic dynein intermediate chain, putative [Plasmodium relictum]